MLLSSSSRKHTWSMVLQRFKVWGDESSCCFATLTCNTLHTPRLASQSHTQAINRCTTVHSGGQVCCHRTWLELSSMVLSCPIILGFNHLGPPWNCTSPTSLGRSEDWHPDFYTCIRFTLRTSWDDGPLFTPLRCQFFSLEKASGSSESMRLAGKERRIHHDWKSKVS